MTGAQCLPLEMARALSVLFQPGDVAEMRAPKAGKYKTVSGYFNDWSALAKAAAQWSGRAPGVYVTLNPVDPALLARAENRAVPYAELTTSDSNILTRRWLLVDIDAARPAGISATEEEHEAALALAGTVRAVLIGEGWTAPVVADSGNGAHLLYRVDLPSEDGGLVARVLKALAFRFDTATLHVDTTVGNPGRPVKLYGTLAAKGDSTQDRPHRLARLLEVPAGLAPVALALLRKMADSVPQLATQRHAPHPSTFDLVGWMQRYCPDARGPVPWEGGQRWALKECPWRPEDGATAYVVQLAGGGISAACHHATCPGSNATGSHWRELRAMLEPPPPPLDEEQWAKLERGDNGHHIANALEEPALRYPCDDDDDDERKRLAKIRRYWASLREEDLRPALSDRLKLSIGGVSQYLTRPERFILHAEGQDIELGGVRGLTSEREFCESLARSAHVYPTFRRGEWPAVRSALLCLVSDVPVAQGSDQDILPDLLAEYLEGHKPLNVGEDVKPGAAQGGLTRRWPYTKDGVVYVFLADFSLWALHEHGIKKSWAQWAGLFVEVLHAVSIRERPVPGAPLVRVWKVPV